MDDLKPTVENQGLIAASLRIAQWLKFILVLLIFLEVALTCCNIAGSFDFPWQFAEGDFILDHGYPARSVLQAYGEVSPHFENEYILYEILISGINRVTGWIGVCIFFGALGFSIYLPCLLAFLKSRYRFALIDVCLFLLAQFLINMRLSSRPELVADLCYVLAGIMLMRSQTQPWSGAQTLAFGLIFFLWSNAHGTFLLGGAMLALWYLQLFLFHWKKLLFTRDFNWLKPGLAALIGCAVNPFGFYRFIQPFELHSLLWGQATSTEMWPVTSGIMLLPITWTIAAVLVLIMRVRERKFYWMIAMLFLLQFLTFWSIRYNVFIALTLLVIAWDGLTHPREPVSPSIFPLFFAIARVAVYFYLVIFFLHFSYSVFQTKVDMFRDYSRNIYPKNRILITSSFKWLKEHPAENYNILSNLSAGSWSQMPGIPGIHPLIDSGTHRYSDRTNQFFYYTMSSPKTFRLASVKLNINAIVINNSNFFWAPVLNTSPDWRLVQIESDSQLYLRRDHQSVDEDHQLFSKWDSDAQHNAVTTALPGHPLEILSERIIRGLKLRPDAESLNLFSMVSDHIWSEDPNLVYIKEWLDQVPDQTVADALSKFSDKMENNSAGLRILLLLRLQQNQQAADIARNWHPAVFDMGYQNLEMLRAEAFLRSGDQKAARKILDGFWPKPRYSLRWARLCMEVYADDPQAIPTNARLLTDMADRFDWQEELIPTLNQNMAHLSSAPSP